MRLQGLLIGALSLGLLIAPRAKSGEASLPLDRQGGSPRVFAARGVVEELKPDARAVVIRHDAISNYMAAMTMPFKVKTPEILAGLHRGDEVTFQLHVTESESWVDNLTKIGTVTLPPRQPTTGTTAGHDRLFSPSPPQKEERAGVRRPMVSDSNPLTSTLSPVTRGEGVNDGHLQPVAGSEAPRPRSPLLDYEFTNELGQAVSLNAFHGQALAITFFYTRCPLPDYCPRLSKNFQLAQQKLESMTGAPTNWHLLSVSFDPEFDSPAVLKAYGAMYHYDPAHWSFLTGPPDKIGELARAAGVVYQPDEGTINHNFRTLILNASGRLQTVFPTSGDLSEDIVAEIIKAAAVTNQSVSRN